MKSEGLENLGKEGRDKITGFEGIIVARVVFLFGCAQYGIAARVHDSATGKRGDTEYFDEGRIDIIGSGIAPELVKVEKPGADHNHDAPHR